MRKIRKKDLERKRIAKEKGKWNERRHREDIRTDLEGVYSHLQAA